MASEVALGAAMRANLLSLQKTNSLLDSTQLKLSTGRKVNSALDNPLSFFMAQSLTNRSNDLGRLLDSMGQSISSIKEADKGVTSMTKLIEQAQATVSDAQETLDAGNPSTVVGNATLVGTDVMVADLGVTANAVLTVEIDGTDHDFTIAAGDTVTDLVTAINTAFATTGTAAVNADGKLQITATGGGAVVLGGTASTFTTADYEALGLADAFAENASRTASADRLDTLQANYDELLSQIDGLVRDANYRGTNLLGGDTLTTYFNEDRTNSLTTVGQDLTAAGLTLEGADLRTASGLTAAEAKVRTALASARDFGAAMANSLAILQTREDFTMQTRQVLEEGADKLTLADPNEEGAKMLALQTRLQLGVTSLSLAAQSQQSVLSLF